MGVRDHTHSKSCYSMGAQRSVPGTSRSYRWQHNAFGKQQEVHLFRRASSNPKFHDSWQLHFKLVGIESEFPTVSNTQMFWCSSKSDPRTGPLEDPDEELSWEPLPGC